MFSIINKARLLNGWTMRTAKELDPTIRVWFEAFAGYGIPISAYDELYRMAVDAKQRKQQDGREVSIDATLLISLWDGPHGLKSILKQREIDAGRTLGANAASVCHRCHGSGFERYQDGEYWNSRKCDHGD